MRKAFLLVASILALTTIMSMAYAQTPVRVDLNGEMVTELEAYGTTPNAPYFWDLYSEGAGGGYAGVYNTGSSSNLYNLRYEDESAYTSTNVYPGGHGVIFGASNGIGKYGLKQSYNTATAGKLYWFLGAQRYNTGNSANVPWFDYGIESGTGISNGRLQTGNLMSSLNGNAMFTSATVATGSEITYHFGHKEEVGARGINSYFDGMRVYEFDIPINNAIQNGNMEAAAVNVTNYRAKGGTDNETFYLPGWLPFGNAAAQVQKYLQIVDGGSNVLSMDQYKGKGRTYAFQRLNKGAGTYTISGLLKTDNLLECDARIGIDFTGGIDPNGASVVWSDAMTATNTWTEKVLTANAGANGITIWLATGYNGTATRGTYGRSLFDNITLSNFVATPEPSSMLALASGLIGMAGFVIRRRK